MRWLVADYTVNAALLFFHFWVFSFGSWVVNFEILLFLRVIKNLKNMSEIKNIQKDAE